MDKTALITGVTGQDGSYLSELLLDKGYKVHGLIRRSSVDTTERIAHIVHHPNFELVSGDITDAACMHRLISGIQPAEVYNLAAMSHVGVSFDQFPPYLFAVVDASHRVITMRAPILSLTFLLPVIPSGIMVQVGVGHNDRFMVRVFGKYFIGPLERLITRTPL